MLRSLDAIGALPDETRIWPGHEYAVENVAFARTLEKDNVHLNDKMKWITEQRHEKRPTCPSTVAEEKLYNPFLRTTDSKFLASLGLQQDQNDSNEKSGLTFSGRLNALRFLRGKRDEFEM